MNVSTKALDADLGWLAGTYWYCPAESLPATQGRPRNRFRWVEDQTVWSITGCRDRYFWGAGSALTTAVGKKPKVRRKSDFTFFGSVTPEGRVHLTFLMASGSSTIGTGRLTEHAGGPSFEMQMSAGSSSSLLVHWAYMLPVTPDDPQWQSLPGVGVSMERMLEGTEAPRMAPPEG